MDNIDITQKTDEELSALSRAITVEQSRRKTIADAEKEAEELAQRYSDAIGRKNGDAWVQPTGAHDAYVATALVEHNGQLWESLIPGNVWEPGQAGWRVRTADGTPPPFQTPSGASDAYREGELITWEDGQVYRAVRNGVVHSPSEYAADWELVVVEPEPEPEPEDPEDPEEPTEPEAPVEPTPEDPDEPTDPEVPVEPEPEVPVDPTEPEDPEDPEEPTEPEVPAWVQPTGGHDAYQMGDQVTFEGKVYESLIDGNVWSPADYPQGWQELVEDEPEEPADPEEPEEPEDPAPVESTDPEEPEPGNGDGDEDEEPTEPDPEPDPDPEEPEIPEIPVEPTPEEPVEPEDPAEPSPEDPDEPTDPEEPVVPEPEPEEPEIPEEPTPEVPEWVQPTGGHDTYSIGDQVLFEGVIYESVINGNSWSPAAYPQGWKVV